MSFYPGSKNLHKIEVKECVEPIVNSIRESNETVNNLDKLHADKTREYVQALSREEMEIAASIIPADILLQALAFKFERLNGLENRVKDLLKEE